MVKLGNSFSTERELDTGDLQGSFLGPMLFIIYFNSIPCNELLYKYMMHMYIFVVLKFKLYWLYFELRSGCISDSDFSTFCSVIN